MLKMNKYFWKLLIRLQLDCFQVVIRNKALREDRK